ncbi:MAG: sulfatase-like hydrolase/transferase [Muribaculaceae bacterium]
MGRTILQRTATYCVDAVVSQIPLFVLLAVFWLAPAFFKPIEYLSHRWIIIYPCTQPICLGFFVLLITYRCNFIRKVIILLSTLLFYAELFCFFSQGTRIGPVPLTLTLQTNYAEATEFFSVSANWLALIKAFILESAILSAYIIFNIHWKRKYETLNRIIKRLPLYTLFSIEIIAVIGSVFCLSRKTQASFTRYWQHNSHLNSYFCSPCVYYWAVKDIVDINKSQNLDEIIQACQDAVVIDNAPNDSLTIVYVIGESQIKGRSSLYGYFIDTNHHMRQLMECNSLIPLDNVISMTQNTINEYPEMLSLHSQSDSKSISKYPILPAIMKKAGFYSAYYDNQSVLNGNNFDFACNHLIARNDIKRICFDSTNESTLSYDGDITSKYPPTSNHLKSFYIYHLLGQHTVCDNHTPSDYKSFSAEYYRIVPNLDENGRIRMAAYDNSVHYTDSIIFAIISQIENRNAILVYCSDHGEEHYDYRDQEGRLLGIVEIPTLKLYHEVPAFIWMSKKYREKHPSYYHIMTDNSSIPLYNGDITSIILELASITVPNVRLHSSLLQGIGNSYRTLNNGAIKYDAHRHQFDTIKMRYSNIQPIY